MVMTSYLKALKAKRKIYLVNDHYFNPLSAVTAARAVRSIVAKRHIGIFHLGGKSKVSRYDLVGILAEVFKLDHHELLKPVTNSYFNSSTARPLDATLT